MKLILLIFIPLITLYALMQFNSVDKEAIPIAILTPATHPSLEQIEKGFKQTLEKEGKGKYHFVTYNAQGNPTLMRSEIEEIALKNYALVFSIGTRATQMTKEVFEKKELKTPIVFSVVNDPVGFNIVSSEEIPGRNITGIKEMLHFNEELEILLKYKASIRNILLVYNPLEPGLQKDRLEIERLVKTKEIAFQCVEVFKTNEILAKTSPFIQEADAVIVLKDNTVVAALDVLVKLCDRHQVPLMASDLDSPDRGAAFGYGVYEIEFGKEAARKVIQILDEGVRPGTIPVTAVSGFTLRLNEEAAKRQGVNLL